MNVFTDGLLEILGRDAFQFSRARESAPSRGGHPRLLFLTHIFPPVQGIGSVRTWNIAKYMARLGWDVTVVTPAPGLWRHIERLDRITENLQTEGIRRISTDHYWRFLIPEELSCWNKGVGWFAGGICRRFAHRFGIDRGVGWIKAAERACLRLVPQEVDLILASGWPFAAFMLAARISKRLGRPYVLDYRDPWSDPGIEVSGIIPSLQSALIRLESRLLKGAAAVTTVSPSWASDLDSRFKVGSKLHVLTNGFDPEELAQVTAHNFGHFAIVYAGVFYPPERVITPVVAMLKHLKTNRRVGECYFHYYGDGEHEAHVREEALRFGVLDRVKLHGKVSRSEALSAVRGANIAVVITSVFEGTAGRISGWVPAKLFEAIGLGTPTLLIAPAQTDVVKIAGSTGLARRFTGDHIGEIAAFVEQMMSGLTLKRANADIYRWECIAEKLDCILRERIVRSNPTASGN